MTKAYNKACLFHNVFWKQPLQRFRQRVCWSDLLFLTSQDFKEIADSSFILF